MSTTADRGELKPSGPAAAVLAAGIGTFVLGLFTTLNEASTDINDFLRFSDDVGPLSGKTIIAAAAFFVSWAILGYLWREREIAWRPVLTATVVLLALGFLGTFPTFFEAFAD
jgi:fluoride ion exporter CrcB/FEX